MTPTRCLDREKLKEYLTGWSDPELSAAIESHLQECSLCEQTIAELESHHDTLMEFASRQTDSTDQKPLDAAVASALSQVKQLALGTTPKLVDIPELPAGDIGAYELIRPIGRGGMGSVYLARHRQLGKQVAIKLLPTSAILPQSLAARFQREIRACGELSHPSIVNATDAGLHQGTHYLVMEFIDGLDLSRVAKFTGPLPIPEACEIIRQAANGLSHAHAMGIVHRDIKPSNLMLSRDGAVKILDFGLARHSLWDEASAELTTVGQLMGTLDYMAPEQVDRPESVDYHADLYSLGATLYRLLCGHAPLAVAPNMSPLAKLRLLATQASPLLSTIRTDAPSGLTDIVAELLARNPEERPASAAHLAEALKPFCEGADLSALATKARIASEKSIDETPENLAPSLPKLPIAPKSSLQETRPTPALQSNAGRSHRGWWAVAAALAPLAIVAGIFIALETQKGKLIIESDNANVSVKLLRDGVVYEQLKVEPGQQETRLYAGKYQVTIDGSSDGIVLDGEQIEVRQGKTTIARIRRESSSAPLSATNPPTTIASDKATYEGHPLSYWMAEYEREKSAEGLKKSLTAIEKLLPQEKANFVTDQLLKNDMQLLRDKVFDMEEFRDFFRRANPGAAYPRMLIRELEKIDASSKRMFMRLCFKHPNSMKDFYEFSEFRSWIEGSVFTGKQPELLADCALLYLGMITDSRFAFSRSEYLSLYDALDKSDQLGKPFWFAMSSERFRRDAGNAFPLASAEDQAIVILEDPKSTRGDVALASAWLRIKGESIQGRESAIAKAICNQLRVQLPKLNNQNSREVHLEHWFDFDLLCLSGQQSLIPNLKIVKANEPVRGKKNQEELFPTLELLALAKSYPSDDLKELLNEVLKLMDNSSLSNNMLIPAEPVTLYWPSMVSPQFSVHSSRWEHILIRKYAQILKEELSPNENPEETKTGTPSETKPSDAPKSTEPTEPMTATFKGRTLEQWLALVKVEQSADGLADAFDGMAGLLSPETSPKVLEATLEVLRKGRGVGDQERQSTSGFKLLRLCAGEGYGKLLTDEIATENKDWSLRILNALHAARSNSGKWEPEHLAVLNWLTDENHKTAVPYSSLVFGMLSDDDFPPATMETVFRAAEKQFGIDFLLHSPLSLPDLKLASSMPKLIDLAASTLSDENSEPKMVALAATFLGQRAESIPPQKLPEVISVAERRLKELVANKESLIALTISDAPPVGINSVRGDLQIRGQLSVQELREFSQTISILSLIFYVGAPSSSEASVQAVLDLTAGSREAVRGVLAASNRDNVLVGWPFLERFQSEQADFVSKLAPDIWREACVHAVAELVMGSIANTKSLQTEITDPKVVAELADAKRFMAKKDKTGLGRGLSEQVGNMDGRHIPFGFPALRRFDEDRNGEISITEYAKFLANKKSQQTK